MNGAYLYCIEMGAVAKVGSTANPNSRLASVRSTAPFDMKFRHLLDLGDARCAAAWETSILQKASRYRERGEWVVLDRYLDDLFEEVAPAVDAMDEFPADRRSGRPIPFYSEDECDLLLHRANLRRQVGPVAATLAGSLAGPTGYQKGVIRARLSQGYGVEDIAAIDGISAAAARSEVKRLRALGKLPDVLSGRPIPLRRAVGRNREGVA